MLRWPAAIGSVGLSSVDSCRESKRSALLLDIGDGRFKALSSPTSAYLSHGQPPARQGFTLSVTLPQLVSRGLSDPRLSWLQNLGSAHRKAGHGVQKVLRERFLRAKVYLTDKLKDHYQDISKALATLDKSKTGSVSLCKLRKVLRDCGCPLKEVELSSLMNRFLSPRHCCATGDTCAPSPSSVTSALILVLIFSTLLVRLGESLAVLDGSVPLPDSVLVGGVFGLLLEAVVEAFSRITRHQPPSPSAPPPHGNAELPRAPRVVWWHPGPQLARGVDSLCVFAPAHCQLIVILLNRPFHGLVPGTFLMCLVNEFRSFVLPELLLISARRRAPALSLWF
ncbi:hypothetical protein GHT09_010049 [Marmota monax]|uniref:EF-hand domain-containing protein n=1 Tax=Marmota monax TaxID=9995 RepID=A0A834PNM2_MARMO|nr:hypothetical protein GHT09_010049 [Marmota monax]